MRVSLVCNANGGMLNKKQHHHVENPMRPLHTSGVMCLSSRPANLCSLIASTHVTRNNILHADILLRRHWRMSASILRLPPPPQLYIRPRKSSTQWFVEGCMRIIIMGQCWSVTTQRRVEHLDDSSLEVHVWISCQPPASLKTPCGGQVER